MSVSTIKPQELAELCKEGKKIDLIDVLTPVEYREVHVEIARNVPLDQLDVAALMHARNNPAHEPLYVICRSGSRGQQACETFLKAGFSNVVNIEGGTGVRGGRSSVRSLGMTHSTDPSCVPSQWSRAASRFKWCA
jgi:rhodanese-related sulfurtransferase